MAIPLSNNQEVKASPGSAARTYSEILADIRTGGNLKVLDGGLSAVKNNTVVSSLGLSKMAKGTLASVASFAAVDLGFNIFNMASRWDEFCDYAINAPSIGDSGFVWINPFNINGVLDDWAMGDTFSLTGKDLEDIKKLFNSCIDGTFCSPDTLFTATSFQNGDKIFDCIPGLRSYINSNFPIGLSSYPSDPRASFLLDLTHCSYFYISATYYSSTVIDYFFCNFDINSSKSFDRITPSIRLKINSNSNKISIETRSSIPYQFSQKLVNGNNLYSPSGVLIGSYISSTGLNCGGKPLGNDFKSNISTTTAKPTKDANKNGNTDFALTESAKLEYVNQLYSKLKNLFDKGYTSNNGTEFDGLSEAQAKQVLNNLYDDLYKLDKNKIKITEDSPIPDNEVVLQPDKLPSIDPSKVQDPAKDPLKEGDFIPESEKNPNPGTSTNPGTNPGTDGDGDGDGGSDEIKNPDEEELKKISIIDLSKKFPFCLPFDLYNCFKIFKADKIEPIFDVTIPEIKLLNSSVIKPMTFKIDLTKFDTVIKILRELLIIGFIYFLIVITKHIMS